MRPADIRPSTVLGHTTVWLDTTPAKYIGYIICILE